MDSEMDPLLYASVVPTLFRLIPEAKSAYEACDVPGDPLPYVVFGFLDGSFLSPAIDSGKDTELLMRIFGFLEQMACSSDPEVVNLLWVELLETWVANPTILSAAFKHMGPATKALATEAAHRLGCGNNLP
jgi:hypothetical protein